jgi:hypothetical protein
MARCSPLGKPSGHSIDSCTLGYFRQSICYC